MNKMNIEELNETEPSNYFEHCYMCEEVKKNVKCYPEELLTNYKRKIFINLGSQQFHTSTEWFKNNYTHMKDNFDKWEVYCFECDKSKIGGYEKYNNIKVFNEAVYNKNGYVDVCGLGTMCKVISEDGLCGNSKSKKNKLKCINFIEFIKQNFNKDDFILIKCDIEGSEFAILPDIIENSEYINELFIEFHYNRWMNPGGIKNSWINAGKPKEFNVKHNKFRHTDFKHTYSECIELMKQLRNKGIYAHWWP